MSVFCLDEYLRAYDVKHIGILHLPMFIEQNYLTIISIRNFTEGKNHVRGPGDGFMRQWSGSPLVQIMIACRLCGDAHCLNQCRFSCRLVPSTMLTISGDQIGTYEFVPLIGYKTSLGKCNIKEKQNMNRKLARKLYDTNVWHVNMTNPVVIHHLPKF